MNRGGSIFFFIYRIIFITLVILVPSGLVQGEKIPNQNYFGKFPLQFENLSLPDDIYQSGIKEILQDSRGFLWICTGEKMYRFDGYDFVAYPKDSNIRISWSNHNITCLIEDQTGHLWIGTENGIYKYQRNADKIVSFHSETAYQNKSIPDFINCLARNKTNRIWMGTTEGLFLLDPAQNQIDKFNLDAKTAETINRGNIVDITETLDGKYWIATDQGLFFIQSEGKDIQFLQINDSIQKEIQDIKITDLFVDSDGILWIGTEGSGLYHILPGTTKVSKHQHNPSDPAGISGHIINHICEDNQGRIWIGYQGAGIDIFERKKNMFFNQPHDPLDPKSIGQNEITFLYRDRSDTIWVGTQDYKVNFWNPSLQKFRLYHNNPADKTSLGIMSVNSICEDNTGKIWIGGYNGLDLFDPSTDQFLHVSNRIWNPGIIRIVYINPHSSGNHIWLGIENATHELIKLDINSMRVTTNLDLNTTSEFNGSRVITMVAEDENLLWIGTDRGLFKMETNTLNPSQVKATTSGAKFPDESQINVLYQDREGNIWWGTKQAGLNHYNVRTQEYKRYLYSENDINSISINEVLSIMEDRQGRLWVGTSRGLNQFIKDKGNFIHFTRKNGLPDSTVTGILPGYDNDLWISTKRGLSHFDIDKNSFSNFYANDGLQSNTFNTGAYKKSKSGQLFFGGPRGFNCFYPHEARINQYIPPVHIYNFKTYKKPGQIWQSKNMPPPRYDSKNGSTEIQLSPSERKLIFYFTALNFIFPEKNQYAIMMEGLDNEWNQIGNQRFATYSGLPPGEYLFKVKASNNEGLWNEGGASIKIIVSPPFFSITWVRLLGLAVFVITLFLFHLLRTFSLQKRNYSLKKENLQFGEELNEYKRGDNEIRASEKKYRHLVESSNDAIYILYNRKYELINQKFKDLFKVSHEDVCGKDFDYLDLVSLKSKNFVEKRIQTLINSEKVDSQFNFTALTKDKRELEIEASVTSIKYKDGIAVQGILRDITERKNMEKMVQQAQKLEALGTLAGGIAHDFNNLLTGIQGRVSLMQMGYDKKSSPTDHLKEIEHYVRNAAELTKQLLGFARKGKFEVKPIDINNLVRENVMMFGRTKKEIAIRAQYQKDIWSVEVDPGQLDQVFMNLFVNAWQAMPDGGDILIETKNVFLDQNQTRPHQINPGKYIKITVTDTGKGMDDETKQRIFDPFFTTKERGRGTGLGLATVYGILKNHGGFITVHSELGIGTTFDIFLPASSKRPIVETVVKEDLLYGTETILLVDDEEIVIEVVGQILESLGYEVFLARSGQEAIETYWGKKSEIDLVILDLIMPKMSGSATYERLRGIDPKVKVLLSSGYSVDGQASELLKHGCNGFIQKPFNNKELSKKIRDILDNKEKP